MGDCGEESCRRETVATQTKPTRSGSSHVTAPAGFPLPGPAQIRIPQRKEKKKPGTVHGRSIKMDDDFDGAEVRVVDGPAAKVADAQSKRKRKREKEKANKAQPKPPKKAKSSSEDEEDGGVKLKPSKTVTEKDDGSINEDIAKMAPSMLADYVGQRLKHWESALSSVELEDKYIPGWCFCSRNYAMMEC